MKFNTMDKLVISAFSIMVCGAIATIVYAINCNQNALMIKSITTRDVNKDGLDDIVITHQDNHNEAYIKQKDNSYKSWNEIRDEMYSSINNPVEEEINKVQKGAQ